jgi:hypothetical protein
MTCCTEANAEHDSRHLMLSSQYWADWEPTAAAPDIIRRDTRLYWQPQRQGTVGRSVGAFVGENPGSAVSIFGLGFAGYSPIWQKRQPGDSMLRLLLEIWRFAVTKGLHRRIISKSSTRTIS